MPKANIKWAFMSCRALVSNFIFIFIKVYDTTPFIYYYFYYTDSITEVQKGYLPCQRFLNKR